MKKYVNASVVDTIRAKEFLEYHDDPDNYPNNQSNFDKMYDILSKYGTEDEPVDVVFKRAPVEDQIKMLNLIKPSPKLGVSGYARTLYNQAKHNDIADRNYCNGVKDAFEALAKEGYIDLAEFRI